MQKLPVSIAVASHFAGHAVSPAASFTPLRASPEMTSPIPTANYLGSSKVEAFDTCVDRKPDESLDIETRFNKDHFRNVSETLEDTFTMMQSGRMKEMTTSDWSTRMKETECDWSAIASLQEEQRNELLLRSCKAIPGVAAPPMQYFPAPTAAFIGQAVSINESAQKMHSVNLDSLVHERHNLQDAEITRSRKEKNTTGHRGKINSCIGSLVYNIRGILYPSQGLIIPWIITKP